jgi:hypothetical protein
MVAMSVPAGKPPPLLDVATGDGTSQDFAEVCSVLEKGVILVLGEECNSASFLLAVGISRLSQYADHGVEHPVVHHAPGEFAPAEIVEVLVQGGTF